MPKARGLFGNGSGLWQQIGCLKESMSALTNSNPGLRQGVSLSASEAHDLKRLLSVLLAQMGPAASMIPISVAHQIETDGLAGRDRAVARARKSLANRKLRSDHFAKALFGEPGWDLLLELYVADPPGERHNMRSLIEAAGSPSTTSIRWLDYLEKEKLIRRELHPTDRRAVFIKLTDRARERLDKYFNALPVGPELP